MNLNKEWQERAEEYALTHFVGNQKSITELCEEDRDDCQKIIEYQLRGASEMQEAVLKVDIDKILDKLDALAYSAALNAHHRQSFLKKEERIKIARDMFIEAIRNIKPPK